MSAVAVPDTLYHYCGLPSLIGFIKTKQIWLTHIYFLNDHLEHRGFRHLVYERITARGQMVSVDADNASDEAERNRCYHDANCLFALANEIMEKYDEAHDAVFCLSRLDDSLSQWRGYGDDGFGFAVGFETKALTYDPAIQLVRVEYMRDAQVEMADRLIDEAFYLRHASLDVFTQAVSNFRTKVWEYAARFKNDGFAEEQEYRLVYRPDRQRSESYPGEFLKVQYRQRGRDVIPYFEWPFTRGGAPSAICSVVMGPKNSKPEQKTAIESMLIQCGHHNVAVRNSALSWR